MTTTVPAPAPAAVFDRENERAALGAALRSPAAARAVAEVEPSIFFVPLHQAVAAAIRRLAAAGAPVDHVSVLDELKRNGEHEAYGPADRELVDLLAAGTTSNAPHYLERIQSDATRRRMQVLANQLREDLRSYGDVEGTIAQLVELSATSSPAAVKASRLVGGGDFVLDTPESPVPVWGDGEQVAWSSGEYLLINGPTGVGKTTIAQQLALARTGLRSSLAGMAIEPDDRPVLYIAADRPPQAARSLRRMVTEADRQVLDKRLVVWRGPLPSPLTKNPAILGELAADVGAGTVVVDSLKDVAPKLGDDETGQAVKLALSLPCLAGVEVVALHHQRKAQVGAGRPRTLDDVYGSTWITAGAGSVLLVWGTAGDAVVEIDHLKQPVDQVGPLTVVHDHARGITTVQGAVDLFGIVRTSNGINAEGAARALFATDAPDKNDVEKARRRLEQLVKKGLVHPVLGGKSAVDGRQLPTRYYPVEARS